MPQTKLIKNPVYEVLLDSQPFCTFSKLNIICLNMLPNMVGFQSFRLIDHYG